MTLFFFKIVYNIFCMKYTRFFGFIVFIGFFFGSIHPVAAQEIPARSNYQTLKEERRARVEARLQSFLNGRTSTDQAAEIRLMYQTFQSLETIEENILGFYGTLLAQETPFDTTHTLFPLWEQIIRDLEQVLASSRSSLAQAEQVLAEYTSLIERNGRLRTSEAAQTLRGTYRAHLEAARASLVEARLLIIQGTRLLRIHKDATLLETPENQVFLNELQQTLS
jgi:hypothetical protein